jgi:hypothetical protein
VAAAYPVAVRARRDEVDREAPPAVVTAVAIGTAPLPIVGVYTVLFLVHGSVHPVQPPDVTSSKQGEFVVGWIALAVFVLLTIALFWLLNGRRRWPFALMQVGLLALCIDFASDDTVSGRFVSVLIAIATVLALAFAFAPSAWRYLDRPVPPLLGSLWGRLPFPRRATEAAGGRHLAGSSVPSEVEPASLRRQHADESAPAS